VFVVGIFSFPEGGKPSYIYSCSVARDPSGETVFLPFFVGVQVLYALGR
jgi:hypothetical protein